MFVGAPGYETYKASGETRADVLFGEVNISAAPEQRHILLQNDVPSYSLSDYQVSPLETLAHGASRRSNGCLFVRGFRIDRIEKVSHRLYEGMIPWEWLKLSGWKINNQDHVPNQLWRSLIAGRDAEGQKPGPYYRQGCLLAIRHRNRNGDILTTDLIRHGSPTMMVDFLRRAQDVMWNRTLFLPSARSELSANPGPDTGIDLKSADPQSLQNDEHLLNPEGVARTESRLGVGPTNAQAGDIICILFGCSVPVVLRRLPVLDESMDDDPAYKLIGEAFMPDLMDGEGLADSCRGPDEWFRLV